MERQQPWWNNRSRLQRSWTNGSLTLWLKFVRAKKKEDNLNTDGVDAPQCTTLRVAEPNSPGNSRPNRARGDDAWWYTAPGKAKPCDPDPAALRGQSGVLPTPLTHEQTEMGKCGSGVKNPKTVLSSSEVKTREPVRVSSDPSGQLPDLPTCPRWKFHFLMVVIPALGSKDVQNIFWRTKYRRNKK